MSPVPASLAVVLRFQEVLHSVSQGFLQRPVFTFALYAHGGILFLFVSKLWLIGILKSNNEKCSGHLRLFTNGCVLFPQIIGAYRNVFSFQVYKIPQTPTPSLSLFPSNSPQRQHPKYSLVCFFPGPFLIPVSVRI